jgi:hypothetical protein
MATDIDTQAPPIAGKPTKPIKSAKCAQCGERIPLEHLPRRALTGRVLCVDCAFDDIPHTD